MALEPTSRARFNLEKASVLMLEGSGMGMDILVQIVTGLGAKSLYRCASVEEAQQAMTGIKDGTCRPGEDGGKVYDNLYSLYRQLHDAFGGVNRAADLGGVMKELSLLRDRAGQDSA